MDIREIRVSYSGRLALAGVLAAIALTHPQDCNAQPVAGPEFDVASVKRQPWTDGSSIGIVIRGNTLDAEHVAVVDLVEFAYNMRPIQVSGGPGWVRREALAVSELYQVVAKAPEGAPPPQAVFRQMLKALLADRFKLRVRLWQKEMDVYKLVVNPDGPKMKESAADTHFDFRVSSIGKYGTRIEAWHMTMEELLGHQLRAYTDRPIFDETGLSSPYDFTLEFTAEKGVHESVAPGEGTGIDDARPLAAAIRLLGLKLEPGKAMFDMLAIDRVERPMAN
jgi:uncharacterized protein (TIGR03435 family)